ncbi:YciI family protein [Rhodobacteraceae bacterium D3-12]|nr:YciI family protein [Rhodobacteraceae bacterium D3-12]
MLMTILFRDTPDADPEIRARHMPEHLDFLEQNRASIRAAGPLLAPDGTVSGGLWLVEVAGAEAADALVRADPFFATGLRESWEICQWRQVFADGARQI